MEEQRGFGGGCGELYGAASAGAVHDDVLRRLCAGTQVRIEMVSERMVSVKYRGRRSYIRGRCDTPHGQCGVDYKLPSFNSIEQRTPAKKAALEWSVCSVNTETTTSKAFGPTSHPGLGR